MEEIMDIKKLIGETTEYEKKQLLETKRVKSWCKSVSAFANTFGGVILFGIDDADDVVGLVNPKQDAEVINEIIKTKIEPIPSFKIQFVEEDEKIILLVEIQKGEDTPYYYHDSAGLEAYVRIGNQSVKANATELKKLVLKSHQTTYDNQKSKYNMNDYSFSKVRERYKKWTGNSFEEKDFVSFGMVDDTGVLTNAGALFVDDSPIYQSRLFCTRWNGFSKSGGVVDAIDAAEYSGSLISLLENGEVFIKRNSKVMWRKTAHSREEMPDYVERSYHEALINALAHRDYLVLGSEVHIDMFDDRLEIYSPGGMPDGSCIQDRDPKRVPSTRRNPVVADIFNRLGLMGEKGSGFAKIIDNYSFQCNYTDDKKPYFFSDRYQFTVILPNLNYRKVKLEKVEDFGANEHDFSAKPNAFGANHVQLKHKIIIYMKENPNITQIQIAQLLHISRRSVQRLIQDLENEKVIERVGSSRGGYWVVKE